MHGRNAMHNTRPVMVELKLFDYLLDSYEILASSRRRKTSLGMGEESMHNMH